jgi:phytoene dehydrogenase-like protein
VRGYALFQDRLHTLPAGALSLLTTGLFDLGDRALAARLLAGVSRLRAEPGESFGAWLERSVERPRVAAVLAMFARVATYTHPVGVLGAKDALAQLALSIREGVRYVHGGWGSVVEGVARRAAELGVVVTTGVDVARVVTRGGRAVAVVDTGGRELACDASVLAVSPRAASALLPESEQLERSSRAAVPVEVACLDVATGPLTGPATTLFGVDEPLYASVHSASARLAPEGGHLVHLARVLSPGERGSREELVALLERLQPGIKVHHARFLPRMTVSCARPDAASGGIAARISRPETPNVALVGDWVGPRGMLLDAVLASAEDAARCLLSGREARSARTA